LLESGLRLLNRADPFVRVNLSEDTGEWILGAAGEIHLETCVNDLQSRFARIALSVSPPLVSFKESVVHPAEVPADAVAGAALERSASCFVRIWLLALRNGRDFLVTDTRDLRIGHLCCDWHAWSHRQSKNRLCYGDFVSLGCIFLLLMRCKWSMTNIDGTLT
jgi:hypothetical protein